ncbi:hypothetical protein PUV54_08830 [Hyphococcus flavus]|uniref:DedA family protein n=1 Tax=Hyphococcus flavus TaxID=1866326 RepID=A0AAE9ZCS4_9PROT|nr:hypothetical protein [Hyphococcus flavus]WDI30062.1 hypothetical protein PUV54_08830 [Hyphococcus flavus]
MGIKDPRLWLAGTVLWGFAEATFFFIVPDVLLTAAVLVFGLSRAFKLCVAASLAAAAGGLLMMQWSLHDIEAARAFLLSIPLIGGDLIARVQSEMQGAWPLNLTLGAVTGAPYKIYAVEAGALGINEALLAVVSFVARLLRFSLAVGLTWGGLMFARAVGLRRFASVGLALAWGSIYAAYIWVRLNAH